MRNENFPEAIFLKQMKKTEDDSVEGFAMEEKPDFAEEFFRSNKEYYRHYAGDTSIAVKPASEAPQEVPTMAIDLENGTMYVNPVFFEDKRYGLDKANFAVSHELEHFLELKELLGTGGGENIWKKHCETLKTKKHLAIFDNCLDDIKMNRSVLKKAPVLEQTRDNLYRENLFVQNDFTDLPKHLQFSYAIAREGNLAENCMVALEVRNEIDALKNKRSASGVSLLDYATSPYTPMAMRLKLQEMYFYPALERLYAEDVENKKQEEKKDKGEGESEPQADGEKAEQEKGPKDEKNASKKEGENGESQNPEDFFKKEYEEYDQNNPHAISIEDVEKAVKKYIQEKKSGKSIEDMSKEAYAQAEGVSIKDLDEYGNFWKQIESIKDAETNEAVIQQLREMFKKIINERKKKKYVPKYPTEEGEILAFPAQAFIAVKQGEHEPKVWETVEQKEKPKEMYGDFDMTLVADRSSSMNGNEKYVEQRKSTVLILEALKDFCDELEEVRKEIEYDLNVRTEAWSFGDENQVEILKPLSKDLTEKQRVHVYKKLADAPGGSTYDFLALEKIRDGISEEDLRKIKNGVLKKIIIVQSDGQSSDASRTQRVLEDLRDKGVTVVGVGITSGGKAVETTYSPDGQVCENPSDLAKVLSDLLKNMLSDV